MREAQQPARATAVTRQQLSWSVVLLRERAVHKTGGTRRSANVLAFAGLISGGEKWLTQARYFLAPILFTESIHKGFTNLNGGL